jgi:hypothetical protein
MVNMNDGSSSEVLNIPSHSNLPAVIDELKLGDELKFPVCTGEC